MCSSSSTKKKKAENVSGRATNREVVLLKEFRKVIPIKKYRSDLRNERRIQTLQFKRSMSPLQENNVIQHGFHHILGTSSFQFLEITSNSLTIAPNEAYDSYSDKQHPGPSSDNLVEQNSMPSSSYSFEQSLQQLNEASQTAEHLSTIPVAHSSSDSDSDIPPISVTGKPVC